MDGNTILRADLLGTFITGVRNALKGDNEVSVYLAFNNARKTFGRANYQFITIMGSFIDILPQWIAFIFSCVKNDNIMCFADGYHAGPICVMEALKIITGIDRSLCQTILPSSISIIGYYSRCIKQGISVTDELNQDLTRLTVVKHRLLRTMLDWCVWIIDQVHDPSSSWQKWSPPVNTDHEDFATYRTLMVQAFVTGYSNHQPILAVIHPDLTRVTEKQWFIDSIGP